MSAEHAPMTKPQKALLAEIREAGILYIKRYGRYDRTAEALCRRGLIRVVEPDYSRNGMDGYSIIKRPQDTDKETDR